MGRRVFRSYYKGHVDKIKGECAGRGGRWELNPLASAPNWHNIAGHLKNRVNSQLNPSLHEVWKPKIAEDIENQTVRRLCRDSIVPGT